MIMWDIYMAGGYGTWYNCDTAWDVITMSTSAGYHAVKTLTQFWSKIDRTRLSPHDELLLLPAAAAASSSPGHSDAAAAAVAAAAVDTADDVIAHCLASVGEEYIVHVHGPTLNSSASRTIELVLAGVASAGDAHGVWTDTTTGETTAMAETIRDGKNRLVAPAGGADSYVLRITLE